jgi:uncharacterized protein
VILCDTGVLLCLVDKSQTQHSAYITAIAGLEKPLLTTWSCLTEAMYLSLKQDGWQMQNSYQDFF